MSLFSTGGLVVAAVLLVLEEVAVVVAAVEEVEEVVVLLLKDEGSLQTGVQEAGSCTTFLGLLYRGQIERRA